MEGRGGNTGIHGAGTATEGSTQERPPQFRVKPAFVIFQVLESSVCFTLGSPALISVRLSDPQMKQTLFCPSTRDPLSSL